jgi:hypothetical protein
MTIFYVVTNGQHTTVISSDNEADGRTGDVSKDDALELAIGRFKEVGLDSSGLSVTHVIDDEDNSAYGWGDGPEAIGLTEGAFIQVASDMADDEVAVDGDAVISGYNVMSWTHIEPNDVLYHLASSAPVANARNMPPRDDRHDASLAASRAALAAYKAFQTNSDSASLAALAAVMKNLEAALGTDGESKVALTSVIQSWEVSESPADFAALSDDGRKPWRVEVEQPSANQLTVAIWPANEKMDEARSGLGLFIEIDKGVPTVHVAPAPHLENSCHIRQVSNHEVRVTPGTNLPEREVQEGVEPGYVFTNGSPQN